MIKQFLKKIFKTISYSIFSIVHGKIVGTLETSDDNRIEVKTVNLENGLKYNIYKIDNGKLYTNRVHDTAAILDNKIINGPSFQFRPIDTPSDPAGYNIFNSEVVNNIVLKIGTPRILRNLNGVVLSLLTGGAGNNNYWHWLYDVLPRIGLCSKSFSLSEINYFLVPNLLRKFQNETLDILDIPKNKRLSSLKYRHIKTKKLIITDHPVAISGNSSLDIQNIPSWIMSWLKNNFIKDKIQKDKNSNKIYIERDLISPNKVPERSIINDEEVKRYLSNKGFVSVRLGEINFIDQVKMFYNADCVLGLHGAAFANIVFCKPGAKIIEFKSLTAGPVIANLAKKNNLNYNSVEAEANYTNKYNFPTQQGHIEIPINSLEKILEKK